MDCTRGAHQRGPRNSTRRTNEESRCVAAPSARRPGSESQRSRLPAAPEDRVSTTTTRGTPGTVGTRSSRSTAPSSTPRQNSSSSLGRTGRKRTASTSSTRGRRSSRPRSPCARRAATPPDLAIFPQPGLLADMASRGLRAAGARGRRRQCRRVLVGGLGGLRHRRRHALRRAADGQRQGLGLVLADAVRGVRLRGPDGLAGTARPHRADPGRDRRAAVVRRASTPTPPRAGRAPTGSRTSCCASPAPRCTTSGSRTRSRSPTRRSSRAFDEFGKILLNPDYVNAGFGDVDTIVPTPFGTDPAAAIADGKCVAAPPGVVLRRLPGRCRRRGRGEDGDVWAFLLPAVRRRRRRRGRRGHRRRRDRRRVRRRGCHGQGAGVPVQPRVGEQPRVASAASSAPTRVSTRRAPPARSCRRRSRSCRSDTTTFRFDASDLMPGAVGAGTFFKGMVDWVNGTPTGHGAPADRGGLAVELTHA